MSHAALTSDQLALLRAELERRGGALRAQLATHLHGETRAQHARDVLQQDGDDAPQRLPERDIAAALTAHEERELAEINAALGRMGDGSYGRCMDCGVDIPLARLQAEPWAMRCIACQTAVEQAQARG